MTLAMVESSSGAASASATNEAMTSGVAGNSSMPPTTWSSWCSRNWKRVATPKLPPPPRMAQKRSGCGVGVSAQEAAIGCHNVGGKQIIDGEAILADEVADAAAQGQPADADGAGVAEAGGEAVGAAAFVYSPAVSPVSAQAVRCLVSMSSARMSARSRTMPPSADAMAGAAVAAAADGERQSGLACQRDHAGDIIRAGDADNDGRTAIEAAVEDGARLIIAGVFRRDDPPLKSGAQALWI